MRATLKHLHLNYICLSAIYFMPMKCYCYFALRASGLGLISSLSLDGRKDIKSVKLAGLIFYSEFRPPCLTHY